MRLTKNDIRQHFNYYKAVCISGNFHTPTIFILDHGQIIADNIELGNFIHDRFTNDFNQFIDHLYKMQKEKYKLEFFYYE